MLLYEALLREGMTALGLPDGFEDVLRRATVVLVDNVAHFYYEENPQEEWNLLEDFPNIAPPWPVAFYEWVMPKRVNSEGVIKPNPMAGYRYGLLVVSDNVDAVLGDIPVEDRAKFAVFQYLAVKVLESRNREAFDAFARIDADDLWRSLPEARRRQWMEAIATVPEQLKESGVRWLAEAHCFTQPARGKPVSFMRYQFPIRADGSLLSTPEGKVQLAYAPSSDDFDAFMHSHTVGYMPLHVPFLAISFSHCKNVEVTAVDPPEKLSRKQEKRYGVPKVRYHMLEISPMRTILKREGRSDEVGVKRALHICRGHFKDYRERGLFGKVRGIFWWDAHVRGTPTQGVVVKDYRVNRP